MARMRGSRTLPKAHYTTKPSKVSRNVPNVAAALRTFLRQVARSLFENRSKLMKGIKKLRVSETDAEVIFAERYMTAHVLGPLLGFSGSVIANKVHAVIDNIWYRKSHQRNAFDGASAAVQLYDCIDHETKAILETQRISTESAEERAAQVSKCETPNTAMQQTVETQAAKTAKQVEDEQDHLDGFYDKPVYTSDEKNTMNTMNTMNTTNTSMGVMSETHDDFAQFAVSLAQSDPITSLFELSTSTMGN